MHYTLYPVTFEIEPQLRMNGGPRFSNTFLEDGAGQSQSIVNTLSRNCPPFERTSKRRRGFPSETRVKAGERVVHGDKELSEKLGRRDLCPCNSGHRFQALLPEVGPLRWCRARLLLLGDSAEPEGGAPVIEPLDNLT